MKIFSLLLFLPLLLPATEFIRPSHMPRIGTVDERFQSFNIEMLEITGGRFWKPFKDIEAAKAKSTAKKAGSTPAGMDPDLYQYRPPIDLTQPRLRKLAAALAPSYMRVSGTWANTTFFQDQEGAAPATPPKGFNGVLTRDQWRRVVEFSHTVNARIITSFATSDGTRDDNHLWTPDQARIFLTANQSMGGDIAAAEFMNEPTFASLGGAPKGYDAAAYARDVKVFLPFLKQTAPEILYLGPGSVGEGGSLALPPQMPMLHTEDLLRATGPVADAFSYHLYTAASSRCGPPSTVSPLAASYLERSGSVTSYYKALREKYDPGKPLWLTETAEAACGGDARASTFIDTFRYLDQLGRLAQQGVQVIAHNTLAASDYGLLDENTYAPRPNYWGALLWNKLMGATVLKPDALPTENLHLYAHCLKNKPGGVGLLVINADETASSSLTIEGNSQRFTLTSANSQNVELNGKQLQLGAEDTLPSLDGVTAQSGPVSFAPKTITFLAIPTASNASCR